MPPAARVLAAGFDEIDEITEEVLSIVGARSGFWVVLNRKDRVLGRARALYRLVVEVNVSDLGVGRQILAISRKAMVLSRDVDLARAEVLDGLVAASVSKLELISRATTSVGEQLVAKANPEEGSAAEQLPDFGMHVVERSGVAGSVG